MTRKVVPMLHVPDVQKTVDWYQSIGFDVVDVGSDGIDAVFAMLSFGETAVMLSAGGRSSTEHRREVDLYTYVDDVDALFDRLKDRVEIVAGLNDTFYGMREF